MLHYMQIQLEHGLAHHLPDYEQLVTTPTGLKKVTRWVIEWGVLG